LFAITVGENKHDDSNNVYNIKRYKKTVNATRHKETQINDNLM